MNVEIVDGYSHIDEIRELVRRYYAELDRNLDFQGIDGELTRLAEKYARPEGMLLAAVCGGKTVGCGAFRKLSDRKLSEGVCEMKRLYVLPEYRSAGAGRMLAERLISLARTAGYGEMVLDTIAPLQSAVRLYKKLGFAETEPYYANPMSDVIYFRKEL